MASRLNPFEAEIRQRIASHLQYQMERRGLTKAQMARRLGVSESNLGRMLSGDRGMSAGFVLRVHRLLSISAEQLLGEEPRRSPPAPRQNQ